MGLRDVIQRWRTPSAPSDEAIAMRREIHEELKPRVERATREGRRLATENNYTARIRALYQEGRA